MSRPSHTALLELADKYGHKEVLEELLNYPSEDDLEEMLDRLRRMWDLDYHEAPEEEEETD